MIAIVDYGLGNLASISNALSKLEANWVLTRDAEVLKSSKGIILPGVGAFEDAMNTLVNLSLVGPIKEIALQGKPILGICLGMQLLFEESYENGRWQGLSLINGRVKRFSDEVKVPHIGWNSVNNKGNHSLLKYSKKESYYYFVHSYYVETDSKNVIGSSFYGKPFTAVVAKDNIMGAQFHPEKSGDCGLNLLKAFKEMI